MWLNENGNPFPDDGLYSTGGNPFLHLAESIFCDLWADRFDVDLSTAPPDEVIPRAGFHLYRLWGEDDRLLYVGVSTRLANRLKSHYRRWGDLIKAVSWEEHPDERAMLAAEREAVRDEDPALNKALV